MSRVINRINQALGRGADERQLRDITHIVIHHSATPRNHTTANFENWWRSPSARMGTPPRGGYHEVVLANGDVEINMQDRRRTWGAANQNNHTWHICVVGQHSNGINTIDQRQLDVLAQRIAEAMRRIGITDVNRVVRHRDLPNQNTSCNDINITNVRNVVSRILSTRNNNTHTVRVGETLSGIASRHNTTVAELARLNNISNPDRINVGQVLRLPNQATNNQIRVGSRVRINQNATHWATGQVISNVARNRNLTVQQIRVRNGVEELLLQEIISWIRRQDVTLV